MNKPLSYYIREFLIDYLPRKRNFSKNTILSYRDTIKLYLNYFINNKIIVENINFEILTQENINSFLDYLETNNNCSINTRNQRLSCLKSLCKYILSYEPSYLNQFQLILKINFKKYNKKIIDYFSKEEIKEILKKPNTNTKKGLKDLMILVLLYDAGLRVSELINLKSEDILLDKPYQVVVKNTKGNKSRNIPITEDTKNIVVKYKEVFLINNGDNLIESNLKKIYTSNGIRKIINKYTKGFRFKVTPHTFRHSKASHLVEANVPLIYIRDFLGHEHIETTEIYAKVNNKMRNNTIINNSIKIESKIRYKLDNDLINWLSNL